MELHNLDFLMLNYKKQIYIQSNKKVWKQKLKMKPKAVYIENMRIPASKQLTLYYNPYSYCSQKVLIALHEKNLSFQSYIIDVTKSKQYDKWFLQISPNGEIPVLQDGNRIITYARNIINYLDEWHTTELNTELFPKDLETIKKATHFRNIIDEIPITILTVGSFIHKISIEDPKPPFTWSIIQYIINGEKQASTYVHQKAELYPEFRGSLLNKAVYLKSQHDQIVNFQEFKKIITVCDDVFDQIEAELSTNSVYKKEFWLINETFTTVDISLSVLLERIYNIGISKLFWGNGKRPNLAKYFKRVRKRKSFQKSMPTRLMNFQMMYGLKVCLAYITGLTCTLGLMISKRYK